VDPSTAPATVRFDERDDVLNGVLLALPIVLAALTIGGALISRRKAA
jgi:hypothetical protein